MTEISLNDHFQELLQVTLQEQQDNDESAKSQYFFQDNNAMKKRCSIKHILQQQ